MELLPQYYWLDKKTKLSKEGDYSVYVEPITIGIPDYIQKAHMGMSRLEKEYTMEWNSIIELTDENYGLSFKVNSKNLKPIMKYEGVRKVKARLRKKKSICVGHIDKDGCYHILMDSPSFKDVYNFSIRCLSYNKKLRKVRKFKRR